MKAAKAAKSAGAKDPNAIKWITDPLDLETIAKFAPNSPVRLMVPVDESEIDFELSARINEHMRRTFDEPKGESIAVLVLDAGHSCNVPTICIFEGRKIIVNGVTRWGGLRKRGTTKFMATVVSCDDLEQVELLRRHLNDTVGNGNTPEDQLLNATQMLARYPEMSLQDASKDSGVPVYKLKIQQSLEKLLSELAARNMPTANIRELTFAKVQHLLPLRKASEGMFIEGAVVVAQHGLRLVEVEELVKCTAPGAGTLSAQWKRFRRWIDSRGRLDVGPRTRSSRRGEVVEVVARLPKSARDFFKSARLATSFLESNDGDIATMFNVEPGTRQYIEIVNILTGLYYQLQPVVSLAASAAIQEPANTPPWATRTPNESDA